MVQILLRLSEKTGEWGLVELQGQLETRHQVPLDNMHVGDLHFDLQVRVLALQFYSQKGVDEFSVFIYIYYFLLSSISFIHPLLPSFLSATQSLSLSL